MYAGFDRLLIIACMSIYMLVTPLPASAEKLHFHPACDGGECSVSLDSGSNLSKEFCSAASIVVWNKSAPGYYMVQCDCECTMQANQIWLVDRNKKKIFGFSSGRIVSLSFIRQANSETEVPDRFSPVKFCRAPRHSLLRKAIFVMLHKRPGESVQPYCYEVIYVHPKGSSVMISGDDGLIHRDNEDYWLSSISRRQRSALLSIVKNINE